MVQVSFLGTLRESRIFFSESSVRSVVKSLILIDQSIFSYAKLSYFGRASVRNCEQRFVGSNKFHMFVCANCLAGASMLFAKFLESPEQLFEHREIRVVASFGN